MRERSEAQEEMRRESGQLSVRQIPSTFMFLCYTPALQHSLQDLRLCKLFHILFALSEETLRGIISNKMSLHSSCISSVLLFFFQILFIIFQILTIAGAAAPVQHCNQVLPFIVELIIYGRDMELREVEKKYPKMHRELDWTIFSMTCGEMQLNCDRGATPTTTRTAESRSSGGLFNPITNIRWLHLGTTSKNDSASLLSRSFITFHKLFSDKHSKFLLVISLYLCAVNNILHLN